MISKLSVRPERVEGLRESFFNSLFNFDLVDDASRSANSIEDRYLTVSLRDSDLREI